MRMPGSTSRGSREAPVPREVSPAVEVPWVRLAGAAVVLVAISTWFGYLDEAGPHPALKLGLACLITVFGLGGVLLVRLLQASGEEVVVDVVRTALALLSMAAALIHFAVVGQHLAVYWLYGWFFVAVGSAQLVWAPLVMVRPSRVLLLAGGLLNAGVVAAWVVSRSYGTLIGPDATEPARAGFGDIVATAVEALVVVGVVILLRRGGVRRGVRAAAGDVVSGFLALAAAPLTALALFSAVGGSPFVSHVG